MPASPSGPVAVTVMVAPPIALPRLSVMAPDSPPAAGTSFTATSTFGLLPSICSTWLDTSKPGRKTVSRYRPGDEPMSLNRKLPVGVGRRALRRRDGRGRTAHRGERRQLGRLARAASVVPSEIGSRTAAVPDPVGRSVDGADHRDGHLGEGATAPPSPPAAARRAARAAGAVRAGAVGAPPPARHRRCRRRRPARRRCRCRPRCWRPTRARWPARATGCSATPDR